jgi:hypothetical protein
MKKSRAGGYLTIVVFKVENTGPQHCIATVTWLPTEEAVYTP